MQIRSLSIPNRGGHSLSARLALPDTATAAGASTAAVALYAHCFTCSKNVKAAANLSRGLVAKGLAVCRFDFTGLGESGGSFADTTFSSNITDLLDVAAYLERELAAPQLLIGHSLGGAAVLQAAGQLPHVRAAVTIGAPAEPKHVLQHFDAVRPRLATEGDATILIEGRTFRFTSAFVDNLVAIDQAAAIRALQRPLLIMHAPLDRIVSIDNAAQIFQTARHPKSFVCLDGADHLLSDAVQALYAGEVIAAWSSKYLGAASGP
ncbi:MAG: alpha/beta fold hydrolase [Desulfosarcinaceae bacterium]|nr:alpha/beta fold hydrolase [Desulfosarcinaceae bacterium]